MLGNSGKMRTSSVAILLVELVLMVSSDELKDTLPAMNICGKYIDKRVGRVGTIFPIIFLRIFLPILVRLWACLRLSTYSHRLCDFESDNSLQSSTMNPRTTSSTAWSKESTKRWINLIFLIPSGNFPITIWDNVPPGIQTSVCFTPGSRFVHRSSTGLSSRSGNFSQIRLFWKPCVTFAKPTTTRVTLSWVQLRNSRWSKCSSQRLCAQIQK